MVTMPLSDMTFQDSMASPYAAYAGNFINRVFAPECPNLAHNYSLDQRLIDTIIKVIRQLIAGHALKFRDALANGGWA